MAQTQNPSSTFHWKPEVPTPWTEKTLKGMGLKSEPGQLGQQRIRHTTVSCGSTLFQGQQAMGGAASQRAAWRVFISQNPSAQEKDDWPLAGTPCQPACLLPAQNAQVRPHKSPRAGY